MAAKWNPRDNPSHRERGPKRYSYTIADVAGLAGCAVSTVRSNRAIVPLDDLAAVIAYVQSRRARLAQVEPVEAWCPERDLERWRGRWPLLDFYRCPVPGCGDLILGSPGMCKRHGGGRPAWTLDDGYFHLLVGGKYEPFHRLLVECDGLDVHHVDLNRWNNRPANLKVMTREQHQEIHRRRPVRR